MADPDMSVEAAGSTSQRAFKRVLQFAGVTVGVIGFGITFRSTYEGVETLFGLPTAYAAPGLVILLAATSIAVERAFHDRSTALLKTLPIYVAALFLCLLFSYTAYYDDAQRAGEDVTSLPTDLADLSSGINGVVPDMADALKKHVENELAGSEAFQTFEAALNKLREEAGDGVNLLIAELQRNKADAAAAALNEQINANGSEQRTLDGKLNQARQQEDMLSDLLAKIGPLVLDLEAGLQRELDESKINVVDGAKAGDAVKRALDLMEEIGRRSKISSPMALVKYRDTPPVPLNTVTNCNTASRLSGVGMCSTALAVARDDLDTRAYSLKSALLDMKATVQLAEDAVTRVKQARAALDTQQAAGTQSISNAAASRDSFDESALLSAQASFKASPTTQSYKTLSDLCGIYSQVVEKGDAAVCEPSAVLTLAQLHDALLVEIARAGEVCTTKVAEAQTSAQIEAETDLGTLSGDNRRGAIIKAFDTVNAASKACIDAIPAQLSAVADNARDRLRNVQDDITPRANSVDRALRELLDVFTGDANSRSYPPVGAALAQELMMLAGAILFFSADRLAGIRSRDEASLDVLDLDPHPEDVKGILAAKNILRRLTGYGSKRELLDLDLDGLLPGARQVVKDLMSELIKRRQARRLKTDDGFAVAPAGVAHLERLVRHARGAEGPVARAEQTPDAVSSAEDIGFQPPAEPVFRVQPAGPAGVAVGATSTRAPETGSGRGGAAASGSPLSRFPIGSRSAETPGAQRQSPLAPSGPDAGLQADDRPGGRTSAGNETTRAPGVAPSFADESEGEGRLASQPRLPQRRRWS